ncbi:MAG: carboxylating nicotinate-nucleotide diphosphorylase [Theionarchaea archaeon]|nr:carboxylating nicotinate-nucleotide diphosphorylase [Theionarchaea archaeon]
MIDLMAQRHLEELLMDDIGYGDISSQLLPQKMGSAHIICKEQCIVSGIEYAQFLFELRGLHVTIMKKEGERVKNGEKIMEIEGEYREILQVERTALNIVTRMSGIATETRTLVEKVQMVNPHCRIASTRKTLLRFFDKKAVITGGGDPHRYRLEDMILLKDNHIAILGIEEAIKRAQAHSFSKKIEIEVSSKKAALEAVQCGVDIVMLDNMTPEDVKETVQVLRDYPVIIEVSGGITHDNIETYAQTGVDVISLGYITHSVQAVNMSLEVTP